MPILISVSAFAVFVWQGHQLTVGTAFTSIALFGMIRYVVFGIEVSSVSDTSLLDHP